MAKQGRPTKYHRRMTGQERQAERRAIKAGKPPPKLRDPPPKRDWSRFPRLPVQVSFQDKDE
jgi:hypothetical protein